MECYTDYRQQIPAPRRRAISNRLARDYPEQVPIIVQPTSTKDPLIAKRRFLAPREMTIGQLLHEVKRHINLHDHQSLLLHTSQGGVILPVNLTITQAYSQYRDDDNMLYLMYRTENTFG